MALLALYLAPLLVPALLLGAVLPPPGAGPRARAIGAAKVGLIATIAAAGALWVLPLLDADDVFLAASLIGAGLVAASVTIWLRRRLSRR